MRLGATLAFLRARLALNLKAAFALRGAFWLAVAFMLANDLIYFSVWWIFFARFPTLGGWELADMMRLNGVLAGSYGLAVVAGGGVKELARTISEGDLDTVLTQPKPPLMQVVASRTVPSGFGDMIHGTLLLALSGSLHFATLPWVILSVISGAICWVSAGVVIHSAAFWMGPIQSLARQVWDFLITFEGYPDTLFAGGLRLVLFTVLPAAFVGWMPARLVREFSWTQLAIVVGAAVAFPLFSAFVFHRGLRRYASGNRFGVQA